jgi:hypothetical protein
LTHGYEHDGPGGAFGSDVDGDAYADNGESDFSGEGSASFKARMERLQDPTSTNLYIEGLPLSIDEGVSVFSRFVGCFDC